MFCKNCGKELVDGAAFCAYCGTAAKVADTQGANKDELATEQAQAQEPSHKRNRTVGIAVAVAVAAVVAAVCIFAFVQHRSYEEAHAAIAVTVNTKIPGYEGDGGTGVPLAVDGVDLDDKSVSERVVVSPGRGEISLKRGTYTVQVAGLAANGEGHVYQAPQGSQQVEVGEHGAVTVSADGAPGGAGSGGAVSSGSSGGSSGSTSGNAQLQFEFVEVPLDQLTDDQVRSIGEWMANFGINQAKTDEIAKQVTAARKAELDRIAEEQRKAEEERQRREEEERKRAEAEAAARRDNLTGTYFCNGKGAPNTGTITFSGHEVTVAGTLNIKGGGSAGNKTWTFADTDDTWYGGYAQGSGNVEFSRDEFESHSSVGNFPQVTIELENGVVKRMVISS